MECFPFQAEVELYEESLERILPVRAKRAPSWGMRPPPPFPSFLGGERKGGQEQKQTSQLVRFELSSDERIVVNMNFVFVTEVELYKL